MSFKTTLAALSVVVLATTTLAQSNVIPGTDVELGLLSEGQDMTNNGNVGTFPTGTSGFSISTTSCNPGTVDVPWLSPMQANHPLISFMFVREEPDQSRLIQVSDYSHVKHGFFALSNSQCYPCQNPAGFAGDFLGVGCSDTYGVSNNGDRFYLGPPEEIDPWLGTWNPVGSYFDCGPPGTPCDGVRDYFGGEPTNVTNRVTCQMSDLDQPGNYFYYGYYVIRAEPEANRENNGNSRAFNPNWNGSNWATGTVSGSGGHLQGTILQRWTGATISSEKNTVGNVDRDGRVYVARKITDNGDGTWHYEFAIHNRDNNGAISEFRIPAGAEVTITNEGFHDVDQNAGNDWTMTTPPGEIVFSTTTNPVRWNTVYNIWFDADAPPVPGDITLTQFTQNPGAAASFDVVAEGLGDGFPDTFIPSCSGDGGDQVACTPCPCGNNAAIGTLGGCLNSTLASASLNATGSNSIAAADMRVEMTGGVPNSFAVLTSGENLAPNNPANPCFGLDSGVLSAFLDGLRCAVTNTQRHGGRPVDAAGTVGVSTNGWGPPSGPPGGIANQAGFVTGQTRHFQIFYRELPGMVCGTEQNTTQAITTTFEP